MDVSASGWGSRRAPHAGGNAATEQTSDLNGLDISPETIQELLRVDIEAWKAEIPGMDTYLDGFGDRLPGRVRFQLDDLARRLG